MKNTRVSEWNKWDLHIHTASSYDSPYKADDADELLCQALAENDIKAVVEAAKGKALTKVIIETCLLTEEEKIIACKLSKEAGSDFVKTSTGFSVGNQL